MKMKKMKTIAASVLLVSAFAAGFVGVAAEAAGTDGKRPEMIYGLLIHLGRNLWGEGNSADHVRCDEKVWGEITAHMADVKANMLVIDLGEALVYPSHPELAVKGSWSVEKMKAEIARLKAMGIEAIPKLNFSACHDHWLGEYARMHSTPKYYEVVADLIRDVAEIFDRPRFIHLGWDEEKAKTQTEKMGYTYACIRQGDLWWHDMLFTAKEAEKHGMRPWIWSDKEWMEKDEFLKRCPRTIVQSHWYYSPFFGPKFDVRDQKKMDEHYRNGWVENDTLCVYRELDDAGFDQICCGSNIYHHNNFHDLVRHCLATVDRKRLLGFLQAPWAEVKDGDEWGGSDGARGLYLDAVDQLAGARGMVERHDAEKGKPRIERAIAEMDARNAAAERSFGAETSVTAYEGKVRCVNGTNVWTDAINAALKEASVVRIPASPAPYYVDGTLIVPSCRKILAEGATVRLLPPCGTVLLRNANAADGTLKPVDRSTGDRNICIVGGRWEDWQTSRKGYGRSGRFNDGVREKGRNFYGVSALLYFGNVETLTVRDVTIANAGGFAIQCGDARNAVFRNIEFDGCFADGLHLNGGIERIHAQNVRGDVGDDLVALNVYDWQDSSVNFGPGDTILCEDLYLRRGYPAIRLLPGVYRFADGSKLDCRLSNVILRNVRGVNCFKMYLQTPAYDIGTDPEWGEVGSAENLWFENVDIDLDFPPDRFGPYLEGDPLRGHFGVFEIGANVKGLNLVNVRANLHADTYPLAHLVCVGPKSCVEKGKNGQLREVFDPWVSCAVDGIVIDGFRSVGRSPDELVHATAFEDVNRDGHSTGRGEVRGVAVRNRPRVARELFNGRDLTGWYTYLKGRGRNADTNGVIIVTNGVVRITGEEWGALVTEEEFSDYRLDVEYRFTGTRFGDKAKKALDSGILFHSTGADGEFYGTWLYSHEYNLITGASGDIWTVGDAKKRPEMVVEAETGRTFTDVTMPEGPYRTNAVWEEGGRKIALRGNRRLCRFDIDSSWTDTPNAPLATNEHPTGEWNTATLVCRGESVECVFNGKTVNKATRVVPSRGKIQLQSEGCGVEFRRVTLTPVD